MFSDVLTAGYAFSIFAIPTLVTTAAILLLGILVLVRERSRMVSGSFFLLTLSVSIWLCTVSVLYCTTDQRAAVWWAKSLYLGVPFIASSTYQFSVSVLKVLQRFKWVVAASWLISALFAVAALATNEFVDGVYTYWWGYYPSYNWLGTLFIAYFCAILVTGMVHYYTEYRKAPPSTHKARIWALMVAFAIGYIGAVDFIPTFGIPLYAFGYLAIVGFMGVATYAIWKYHLVDITPAFAARQILETMSEALLVMDREGTVRLTNRAGKELFGDVVGKPVAEVLGDIPGLADSDTPGAIEALQGYEMSYERGDGNSRVLTLSASVMADKRDQPVSIVCVARDITARKQSEEALRKSEELYRSLVETSPDAIILIAFDGTIRLANQQAAVLYGYDSAEQLLGKNVYEMVPPSASGNTAADTQAALRASSLRNVEYSVLRRNGSAIPVEISATVIPDAEGNPGAILAMLKDITARKVADARIQRQLEQLDALRKIDGAIISNFDLRLTLRVILEQVTEQLHVDAADVLLLNPQTQMLEYAVSRGFKLDRLSHVNLRLGQGYAGRAALDRETVYVRNLTQTGDLLRAPLLEGEDFVSYFAVPLAAKGHLMGVLEVFHRSELDPAPEWVEYLHVLAGQTAISVDNANMLTNLERSNNQLALAYDITLEGWSRALDLRDKETEGHTRRVTEMTVRLARAMGMSEGDLLNIRRGALLHDIGKMGIPDAILLKPGPLTDEEWEIMRKHPVYAYELLYPITYLRQALDIPYCHHEKWDGTGYPRGLRGEQIPEAARIFAIVDVWDALRSDRPYRAAWPEEKVREHIRKLAGTHFDPRAVAKFLEITEKWDAEMSSDGFTTASLITHELLMVSGSTIPLATEKLEVVKATSQVER